MSTATATRCDRIIELIDECLSEMERVPRPIVAPSEPVPSTALDAAA